MVVDHILPCSVVVRPRITTGCRIHDVEASGYTQSYLEYSECFTVRVEGTAAFLGALAMLLSAQLSKSIGRVMQGAVKRLQV